ncbi:MAG TPA: hypothetical protein PKJ26_00110 [Candidatus Woesebacteria bacterium]|nr:hypothetical protein [Candidatus Woesebacteria bacterium]HNS64879.1 hypothetical protein [Candidatus Woesebacteria bacterium]
MKSRYCSLLISIIICIFTGCLLFYNLNNYPPTLYNWENYSVWNIFQQRFNEPTISMASYFQRADGLMTESGFSPIVGLPMYLITEIFGYSLETLRIWPATLTIIGVLVFFLFILKVFGKKISAIATILLITSQGFLLYGRTATNVAPTLLAESVTAALIYYFLLKPKSFALFLSALVMVVINYFFYAPIRFFTPILLFCIARYLLLHVTHLLSNNDAVIKSGEILKLLVIGVFVSFAIVIIYFSKSLFLNYFHARGEQIFASITQINPSVYHIKNPTMQIFVNTKQYLSLLFSIDSKPVIIDYGNHYGQMMHRALVPFFILGFFVMINGLKKKNRKYRLLAFWFLLTCVPILLTNNVHIGRLFLHLSPLFVVVAIGLSKLTEVIISRFNSVFPNRLAVSKRASYTSLSLFLLIISVIEIRAYFLTPPTIDHNIKVLKENESEYISKTIYVINTEASTLHFWEVAFYLREKFYFKDGMNLKPLDMARNQEQVGEGYLFRTQGSLDTLASACDNSDSALIVVGRNSKFKSPLELTNCRASTLLLYQ